MTHNSWYFVFLNAVRRLLPISWLQRCHGPGSRQLSACNWFHFHFLATDPGRWHLSHLPTVLYQLQRNAGASAMVMVERWECCRVWTVGGNLFRLYTMYSLYCNPCMRRCTLITSSMTCNDATDLSNAQETYVSCLNADSCWK